MKFNTLQSAQAFQNRSFKALAIIMGDDGLFWVVPLVEMEKLVKSGFEVI